MFIAYICSMNVSGPFMIVAPLTQVSNWVRDFEQWLPSRPVTCLTSTEELSESIYSGRLDKSNRKNENFPVIVTSYEVAIRDKNRLNTFAQWTHLIIDESQGFENHRCALMSSMIGISTANRLFLPAGPINSDLQEMAMLLHFIRDSTTPLSMVQSTTEECDGDKKQRMATMIHAGLNLFMV